MLTLTTAPIVATVVDEPAPQPAPIAGLRPARRAIIASLLADRILVTRDRDGDYQVMVSEACFTDPAKALIFARQLEREVANEIAFITREEG